MSYNHPRRALTGSRLLTASKDERTFGGCIHVARGDHLPDVDFDAIFLVWIACTSGWRHRIGQRLWEQG